MKTGSQELLLAKNLGQICQAGPVEPSIGMFTDCEGIVDLVLGKGNKSRSVHLILRFLSVAGQAEGSRVCEKVRLQPVGNNGSLFGLLAYLYHHRCTRGLHFSIYCSSSS